MPRSKCMKKRPGPNAEDVEAAVRDVIDKKKFHTFCCQNLPCVKIGPCKDCE